MLIIKLNNKNFINDGFCEPVNKLVLKLDDALSDRSLVQHVYCKKLDTAIHTNYMNKVV